jgi:hypothetical protein
MKHDFCGNSNIKEPKGTMLHIVNQLKSATPVHKLSELCHPGPYTFKVCQNCTETQFGSLISP